jgi:hypothetical protein
MMLIRVATRVKGEYGYPDIPNVRGSSLEPQKECRPDGTNYTKWELMLQRFLLKKRTLKEHNSGRMTDKQLLTGRQEN